MESTFIHLRQLLQKRKIEESTETSGDGETKLQLKKAKSNEETTFEVTSSKNETANTQTTTILELSDDALVEIIKCLPMAQWPYLEGVDRKFRRSVYEAWRSVKKIDIDEDLCVDRKKIVKRDDGHLALDTILLKLLLRAPHIASIGGFRQFGRFPSGADVVKTLARFDNLEEVDLGPMCADDVTTFLETSASRGRVKILDFTSSCFWWYRVAHLEQWKKADEKSNSMKCLCENAWLPSIRFLDLIDVSSLTELTVANARTEFDNSYTNFGIENLIPVIDRCVNLQRLSFSMVCFHKHHQCKVDLHKQFLRSVSDLQHLSALKINGGNDEERWSSINDSAPCTAIHQDVLELIGKLGRRDRLKELSLVKWVCCTDEVFKAVADNLPNLTSLEFSVDDCYTQLHLISNLTQLEHLELTYVKGDRFSIISGYVVSAIAWSLVRLKHLRLDSPSCSSEMLNKLTRLENLKELRIDHCNILVATFGVWGKRFEKLESFGLRCGARLFTKSFAVFVAKLKNLRRLNLSSSSVTDDALQGISSCTKLRLLDLSFCEKISLKGVQAIVDGCSRLKYLKIKFSGVFQVKDQLKIDKYRKLMID